MIRQLQKKWLRICIISILVVFSVILVVISMIATTQVDAAMDELTDRISENNGSFPVEEEEEEASYDPASSPDSGQQPGEDQPAQDFSPFTFEFNFINEETPFSTRFFTVDYNENGDMTAVNTESITAVTEDTAIEYADKVLSKGKERGWIGNYRFKLYDTANGQSIVFVDGGSNRSMAVMLMLTVTLVLVISAIVIMLLVMIFSRRAFKPVKESYEKQQQFITDANHELKTPLTLILTNLDIAESELGQNEWLDDIRSEGEHMSALVNMLVTLTRMDEEQTSLVFSEFDLSQAVSDTASEFVPLAEAKGKSLSIDVAPDIRYNGDEGSLRRLVSILMDNAVKYCDPGGEITISLSVQKKHPVIISENTFAGAADAEVDKLFDRFYRADKARTAGSGFGIGLSIAQSIVRNHHGEISAYRKDKNHIGFKAVLK